MRTSLTPPISDLTAQSITDELRLEAARQMVLGMDVDRVRGLVNRLLELGIYDDSFLEIMDAVNNELTVEVAMHLAPVLLFLDVAPPADRAEALKIIATKHLQDIVSGCTQPVFGLSGLMADIGWENTYADQIPGLQPLLSDYCSYERLCGAANYRFAPGTAYTRHLAELNDTIKADAEVWLSAQNLTDLP
ncbi:MAG: hypothetical protein QM667_13590 [Asticcacaulis sp.]